MSTGRHNFDAGRLSEEHKTIGEGFLMLCKQRTNHKTETDRKDWEVCGKCIVLRFLIAQKVKSHVSSIQFMRKGLSAWRDLPKEYLLAIFVW
jgi:hypothetical protein